MANQEPQRAQSVGCSHFECSKCCKTVPWVEGAPWMVPSGKKNEWIFVCPVCFVEPVPT